MVDFSLALLGGFRVTSGGQLFTDFRSRKVKALLIYLLTEDAFADAPMLHRREALMALLWPEMGRGRAHSNLRQTLYYLRQALAQLGSDSLLLSDRQTVRINPDARYELDVATFLETMGEAARHEHQDLVSCPTCCEALERAADHYAGDFLENFELPRSLPFEEWVLVKQEALRRRALDGMHALADAYLKQGEYEQAQVFAHRQLEIDALREEAHRQLMEALARNGKRTAALRQYKECAKVLQVMLEVDPAPATQRLYKAIANGDLTLRVSASDQRQKPRPQKEKAPGKPQHRLPQLPSPFFGREQEMTLLGERLGTPDCRLLSVVGLGGAGKTRLALEAARAAQDNFQDGVVFVPLAGVSSADYLATTVGDAVGYMFRGNGEEEQQLAAYLRRKELLIILDSYEHLLPEVDLIVKILEEAPAIKLLVTSRERLRLRWEWVVQVGGLSDTPGQDGNKGQPPAVRLFLYHAHRVVPDFHIASDNELQLIQQLCDTVGHLPLAVELAAVAGAAMGPQAIKRNLSQALDLLRHPARDVEDRHTSIRAAFDHSWKLLTPAQQDLLALLSIFPSSFSEEAAVAVASASAERGAEIRRTLSTLVERSLLQWPGDGRYLWHPLLRTYSAEKLGADLQQKQGAHLRHARYYGRLIDRLSKEEGIGDRFLERFATEIENLRQAWQTGVENKDHTVLDQLAYGMRDYYEMRERRREGMPLLKEAIDALGDVVASRSGVSADRQRVLGRLLTSSSLLHWEGSIDEHRRLAERAVALLEPLDAPRDYALALLTRANSYRPAARVAEAIADLEQAISLLEVHGEPIRLAWALRLAGECYFMQGDVATAQRYAQRAHSVAERTGASGRMFLLRRDLGRYATAREEYATARAWLEEAIAVARQAERPRRVGHATTDLLHLLLAEGKYEAAERRLDEVLEELGEPVDRFVDVKIDLKIAAGFLAFERNQPAQARAHAYEALSLSRDLAHTVRGAHVLALAGRLLLDEAPLRAAELLAFTDIHPVGLPAVANDTSALLARLREQLPPERYATACTSAGERDINEIVDALLVELKLWEQPLASATLERR
ncbi:MAG TPA: BTAD domain-containing putative transcriptional regulator [Candidatus Sulfomarinibacteraceae bacterium]|nr:BTAD domain-containing putative transcriptional regulator [Candidatus Sulfomarinibacteraceae bacterium]